MAILKVANIHFDVAGTTVIRANGANTLTFNTSGAEDVRIDDTGNVLIGRINSTVGNNVKLDVNGSINASAVLVNGAPLQTTTLTSNVVISVADNSNAALRITQTGTGDAIRVEDSANPDATPFIVDTTGNVLIGRTNSTVGQGVLLDIAGAINASSILVNGTPFSGGGATVTTDTVNATRYVVFDDSTSGSFTLANVSTSLTFNPSTGTLSSTIFNSTSDINKKTNIQIIDNSLEVLDALSGYRFNWKDNGLPSLGVIAQEVETVLPELIGEDNSVNYNGIIAVLIQAVKELKAEIEVLKNR